MKLNGWELTLSKVRSKLTMDFTNSSKDFCSTISSWKKTLNTRPMSSPVNGVQVSKMLLPKRVTSQSLILKAKS